MHDVEHMNIRVYLVLFSTVAVTGCVAGPRFRTLDVSDVVFLPTVRISKNVYTADRTGAVPSEIETGLAIELGLDHARGSDAQSLTSGEVRIGNQSLMAPQELDSKFDLTTFDVSLRYREFIEDRSIGFELSGGFAYVDLNVSVSSQTTPAAERISSPAFRGGAAVFWRMLPSTRIEGFGTGFATKSNLEGVSRFGVSLVRALGRNASVRGGYSAWQVRSPSTTRSRVELQFSGPSLGLDLHF